MLVISFKDWQIDLDYFLAYNLYKNISYQFRTCLPAACNKVLKILKIDERLCMSADRKSLGRKNLRRRAILLQSKCGQGQSLLPSTIIWFCPFKLWCPTNAVYSTACLSHRGYLSLGTRSGLTSAKLRIYKPL